MAKKLPLFVLILRFYFNSIGLLFPNHSSKWLRKLFSTPRVRVLRKPELAILNQAQKSFINVEGNQLKIYEWGSGNRLAMLFHGWETNAGSLGAFVEPLVTAGFKIVAFDAPAHGGSEGKRANLVYFKKAAKEVISKFGKPDVAIGHSLGADAIIMTAYEEKIAFEKVVLIAPLNRLMSVFEQMKEMLSIPEKLYVPFINDFAKIAGYDFWKFYFHNYGKQTELQKVVLFHDKNDRITNFSHATDFAENWKEVNLRPVENTGHYKILWDESVVSQTMGYIAE